MKPEKLIAIVDNVNSQLDKLLPNVLGIHLRYHNTGYFTINWDQVVLVDSVADNLEAVTCEYPQPDLFLDVLTAEEMETLLAERFTKAYAEFLFKKLEEK